MSGPVAYDVRMEEIAAHCRDVVSRELGVAPGDLPATGFQIVRLSDPDRWVGRVLLARQPTPPSDFEPGETR